MDRKLSVNKLRVLSLFGGAYLILASAWVSVRYGVTLTASESLSTIGMGIAVLFLPVSVAYTKFGVRRILDRWRAWRKPTSRTRIFVTGSPVVDSEDALDSIESTLSNHERYDEIRSEEFSDGSGFTVVYSTYHTISVRVLQSGKLAVSGDSREVDRLVERIEHVVGSPLEQVSVSPFTRPEPVRGAPRAVLALCLIVLVVLGTGSVAGAAYPSNAYNPAEKSVLIWFDLRSDIDPTMTTNDARLAKSAFLVNALDEKPVEIAIVNSTEGRIRHARYALTISEDATELVRAANNSSADRERIERIEADIDRAEREVAATLTESIEAAESDEASELLPVRNELLRRANSSVGDAGVAGRF